MSKRFKRKAVNDLMNFKGKDPFYDSNINQAIYELRLGQHFYLGNEIEIRSVMKHAEGKNLFEGSFAKDVNLPFSNCIFWLETYGDTTPDIAMLVQNNIGNNDAYAIKYLISINIENYGRKWYLLPVGSLINVNMDEVKFKTFCDRFEGSDYYSCPAKQFLGSDKYIGDVARIMGTTYKSYFQQYQMMEKQFLTYLNISLMLLNCKNIAYEEQPPEEKANKKRRKKGKEEEVSYHVLNIVPMSPQKRRRASENGTGQPVRVHLCRGHFKTYTEEAPLFGRHSGRFWWQPHVKGQNKSGIVHKDYNVEV